MTSFWAVFAVVLVALLLAVAGMALGVMFRRPCLRGSCGGPERLGPDGRSISCEACPNRRQGQ